MTPSAAVVNPFGKLNDSMRALAQCGEVRRYRPGVLLIQEDDRGDTLYIVISGAVKAFSIDERDREVIYGTHTAGDYFGEMSLDGGPRSASVMTLETTCCAVIGRAALESFISARPEFAFELLARVIHRARMATRSARSMALLDVYGRVVQLFNELAVQCADGSRLIERRLTHADIAARVGCSREMVSRLVKDLVTGGYLQASGTGWVLAPELPARW